MKKLLALLLLFPVVAVSAPDITGGGPEVGEVVEHDGVYTIQGTGFGTGPRIIYYAEMTGTDGALVSGTTSTGGTVYDQTFNTFVQRPTYCHSDAQTIDGRARYEDERPRHARVATSAKMRQAWSKNFPTTNDDSEDCPTSRIIMDFNTTETEIYAVSWLYKDYNPTSNVNDTGYSNNVKLHSLMGSDGSRADPDTFIGFEALNQNTYANGGHGNLVTGYSAMSDADKAKHCTSWALPSWDNDGKCGIDLAEDGRYDYLYQLDYEDNWVRTDTYVRFQSVWPAIDGASADGQMNHYTYHPTNGFGSHDERVDQWGWETDTGIEGVQQFNANDYHSTRGTTGGCTSQPNGFCISDADTFQQETYVAAGPNARARVEICDSGTYAARTHCEIQPVHANINASSSWGPTEITFAIQQGSLGAFCSGTDFLNTGWIYVVDENNDANATGHAPACSGSPPSNTPPTVALTSPADASSYEVEVDEVTFTATCTDTDTAGANLTVVFKEGTTTLCTSSTGSSPFSCAWTPTVAGGYGVGAYEVFASCTDDDPSPLESVTATNTINVTTTTPPNNEATVTFDAGTPVACTPDEDSCELNTGYQFTLTSADIDGDTVTNVRWQYNCTSVGSDVWQGYATNTGSNTWITSAWSWDVAEACTLSASANDGFGYGAYGTTYGITFIDTGGANADPVGTITAPTDGTILDNGTATTISVTATDDSAVSLVEVGHLVGDGEGAYDFIWLGEAAFISGTNWELDITLQPSAVYELAVRVTDDEAATVLTDIVDATQVTMILPLCFVSGQGYGGYFVVNDDVIFDGIGIPEASSGNFGDGYWQNYTLPAESPIATIAENVAAGVFGQNNSIVGPQTDGCQITMVGGKPTCATPGTDAFPAGMTVLAASPTWNRALNPDAPGLATAVKFTKGTGTVTNWGTSDIAFGLNSWGAGVAQDPVVIKLLFNTLEDQLSGADWTAYTASVDYDYDGDTVIDHEDNCVLDSNLDQTDADVDGEGDACDP